MSPVNPLVVLALAASLALQSVALRSQALQSAAPSPPAPAPAVSADQANRVIAPQDLLKITVVGEADLTVQARVGADGMIPFPFINRTQAGGLTVSRFQQKLTAELADGWLKDPRVRVELEGAKVEASRSVIVRGFVRTPGRVPLTGAKTLLEALADVGMPTAQAGNQITVTRARHTAAGAAPDRNGQPQAGSGGSDDEVINVDLKDTQAAQRLQLQDGDIITVPEIQMFTIAGDVRSQGPYVWEPGLTLGQAVTLAGGLTDRGTMRGAAAQRLVNGVKTTVKLTAADALQPGDQVNIGRRLF